MGTSTNSRHSRRATKRGLASFVSFVLLFAFALGQSSLSALADDAGTDPVAAEEILSDGSTGEGTLPVEEAPAEEAPAEEAPAAEEEAEGDTEASGNVREAATSLTETVESSAGKVVK